MNYSIFGAIIIPLITYKYLYKEKQEKANINMATNIHLRPHIHIRKSKSLSTEYFLSINYHTGNSNFLGYHLKGHHLD